VKNKARVFIGLVALCLVSAIAASLITAVFFIRGYFRQSLVWQPGTSGNAVSDTTTGSLSAGSSQIPTTRVVLNPTTTPAQNITRKPASTTAPSSTGSSHPAVEQLSLLQVQEQIEDIYDSVSPSVAGISVSVSATGTTNERTNKASALIISADGILVTSTGTLSFALDRNGTLKTNAKIEVLLKGHEEPVSAELIGNDILTGISVLSIDPTIVALQPAVFAEAPILKVGQLVLSMGYPDMLASAGGLSSGIITAIDREVMLEDGTGLGMIQTDAHISQSCSGGPLLNLDGEVIGLANCSVSRDISDAMGYALPADVVQQIAKNLVTQGYVSGRAWLGVTVLQENSFLELQNLYRFPDGLYITSVIKDSPAYTADLRKGDIITKINGSDVATHESLVVFLQSQPIGALVDIEVYRKSDGLYHQQNVYLQEYQR
jgi:serine protease Do